MRSYQVYIGNLCTHLDRLESRLLSRLGSKREQVLMLHALRKFIEIWSKCDGAVIRQIVGLAAGAVGNFREKILSRVDSPERVANMTLSTGIDRIYHNSLALRLLNG